MSEEAIKRQKTRMEEALDEYFPSPSFRKRLLSGGPFDLEIFRPRGREVWLVRCVAGPVTKHDQDVVRDDVNPECFVKFIAFRPTPGSPKVCLIEIE